MEGNVAVGPANIGEKLAVSLNFILQRSFMLIYLELAHHQHSTRNHHL